MKNLKNRQLNKLVLLLLLLPSALHAIRSAGGNYELTKTLLGESGVYQATSASYSMAYSLGEDAAGTRSVSPNYEITSGYFSGYASGATGAFALLNATVGPTKILQDGFQIGVPLNASIQLNFSSQLDATTIPNGIQIFVTVDHLANPQNTLLTYAYSYDVTGTTLTITPSGMWPGNSLIDVVANSNLQSIDGFLMSPDAHTRFITMLDPNQENVVLHPLPISVTGAPAASGSPALHMDIPSQSLSDYAYVLVSQDPINYPLQVNPTLLQSATAKAQSSGGLYQTPLAYQEIAAFNGAGRPMSLSKQMSYSVAFSGGIPTSTTASPPIRERTLSLYVLDPVHQLWVKMPNSHPNGPGVIGSVSQFTVYALMGSADGNASSTIVFPNPWRPHGPNAGEGSGQTGTDASGITFSNLPSECTITIFTVSGEKVQSLHHSDLSGAPGQETWDGMTSGGKAVASGVYLWRVESASDGKNGKLMVIR